MSVLEKVVAAVTSPGIEGPRGEARQKALAVAGEGDWLALVLQHHQQIEGAFAAVRAAVDLPTSMLARRWLIVLLRAHSSAEEAILYPALVHFGHKSQGMAGYTEQADAKVDLGELEGLEPGTQNYVDKMLQMQAAVVHHMCAEENDRFLELKRLPQSDQDKLTRRFREEFDRYLGLEGVEYTTVGGRPGERLSPGQSL